MELHEYERPLAVLALQQAEIHRDRKKKRRGYTLDEFYLYHQQENQDLPNGRYGAAARELIALGKFPIWGLFVYNDLMRNAEDIPAPSVLGFISGDAIILSPNCEGNMCNGMLIARQQVSGKLVEFEATNGGTIQIWMPKIKGSVEAIEDCELRILQ